MYDVVVIGAGIAGTFIARELSRYDLKIAIVEKTNDVANSTTMANSAIIHAGYDAPANKKKGYFNAKGNALYDQVCEELDVPFKRIGSLVVAFSEEDKITLQKLYENGLEVGVPGMEILNQEQVLAMEPNLNKEILGALHAPSGGVISPWEMAIALAENAMENGAELFLNKEVKDMKKEDDKFTIFFEDGTMEAKYVINCAGLYSDKINNMVATPLFEIKPRKGEYFILDKSEGNLVSKVIFQCPSEKGKGILVSPTVHGNLLVGPDSEPIDDRDDISTSRDALEMIRETALLTCKNIPYGKVIRSFSGVRSTADYGDFIIGESPEVKGLINIGGFESPGLSSAPAVAQYVVDLMKTITGGLTEKADFNPRRRPFVRFEELSEVEKAELVKNNPKYGRVICRCETITEGEIIDSIHRKAGATTVKGVKKRTRAGMGRCQGGFCSPRVVEILARELNCDIKDIKLDGQSSYILSDRTKNVEE
ncbi:MAG: FAD/NAD(P)-binding oxidoreductase [Firmicutes bacterium HGW-Firmicutes-1]|jgi:glycerol-3-phosphate dehydrogenase|nr:MAG: FAD/NAD(P)-binding oxidoreductase [Firmicutes bacterium HGW-Firmicutes-1]